MDALRNLPENAARRVSSRLAPCLLLATAILALVGPASAAGAPPAVQMVVDYGDGVELRFTALPWRAGRTVLDVLEAAAANPHGLTYKKRGAGINTLVTQIGDVKNEGGGTKSRNWIYRVNGKQADVGIGAYELETGDAILWKFEVPDYNN